MGRPPVRDRGVSLTFAQRVIQVHVTQGYHPHRGRLDHRDRAASGVDHDLAQSRPWQRLVLVLVLGEQAAAAGVDMLVTVGPLAASMSERFGGETHAVADAGEAAAIVPKLVTAGDVVLVKASRGVGLELVCRALGAEEAR